MIEHPPRPRSEGGRVLAAFLVVGVLGLAACIQDDQVLPFELEEGASATASIGAAGGVISLSSGFSLAFPPGALATNRQFTVTPRLTTAFPGDAGVVIPGTAYDISPTDVALAVPARVQIRVGKLDIPEEEQVRLGVAREEGGRSVVTGTGTFDVTSGILSAPLSVLGPVAAVVGDDAIPLGEGGPPTLGGGNFGGASGVSGPAGVSASSGVSAPRDSRTPAAAGAGEEFASSCNPAARRCFSSGLVEVWASPTLIDRLGGKLVILSPALSASLDFTAFDASGQPTQVLGELSIKGTLRVKLGEAVSSYEIDESFTTGPGGDVPSVTGARVEGNRIVLEQTTDGEQDLEYELRRIGSGRMLTVRVEEDVELENDDGSTTTGTVILHLRLRQ